jgi:NAD(P) transhydrogenase subunit alpha
MNISAGANAILDKANDLLASINIMAEQVKSIKFVANNIANSNNDAFGNYPFFMCLTVFILACFIGYYVVWNVTPALHSPLMAVTNAVSSVIIIGAIMVLGASVAEVKAGAFAFIAIVLASINIFGGFMVTQRMLQMFKKKK